MNPARTIGFALVVLQAAALACCFRTPVFSAVVAAVALFGWLSRYRPLSAENVRRWALALVVLSIVQRTVVPPAWSAGRQPLLFRDSCLIAEYFLVFQAMQFFVRRQGDRLPSYLPVLAIVVFTFSGDFRATDQSRLVFQLLSIGLIALTAGYFAACRLSGRQSPAVQPRGRTVLLGGVLLASGALGWLGASSLYRYSRQIETLLGAAMDSRSPPQSAGFSGIGRLGSVARHKTNAGNRVGLRVYAGPRPVYLRGRAFDTYRAGQWSTDDRWTTLTPEPIGASPPTGDVRLFSLAPHETGSSARLEIWPDQPFDQVVFTPLALAALEIPGDKLSVNQHEIVQADQLPPGYPYVAVTASRASGVRPTPDLDHDPAATANARVAGIPADDWELLTALPDQLDPRIRDLAVRVAGKSASAGEKIAAVQRYFLANYQYRFGIDIPAGSDPLTHFLLHKPPAHCEFFASGAAVLLRAVGVPTRYVTGFVAAERNDYGGYWIARNRDAHAWVEAFDPRQGWVVVEATPAAGVPQETSSPGGQLGDAIRARWQRLLTSIRRDGLRAVLRMLGRLCVHPGTLVVLLPIGVAVALRWLRRRRSASPIRPLDPCLIRLQQLLEQMDRRWQKAGLPRRPHETLHQFARRLTSAVPDQAGRQAADWYRQFAAIRFRGQIDPASVQFLHETYAATVASQLGPPQEPSGDRMHNP